MQVTHTHTFKPELDNKIGTQTTNEPLIKSKLQLVHPMPNTYIEHTITGGAGIWLQVWRGRYMAPVILHPD